MITEVGDQMESIHVVENDNFLLVCGGSKFDYKNVKLMHMPQLGKCSELQYYMNLMKFLQSSLVLTA